MHVRNCNEAYEIGAHIIEEFENEITQNISRPLELFFKRIVEERPSSIYCNTTQTISRLLKLLPATKLSPRQQAQVLLFFRSRTGIPDNLLENDVILNGTEGIIPSSRKLLEACFPFFKNEDQKHDVVTLSLGKEALIAFNDYLFTKRIGTQSIPALEELLDFSQLINGMAFQKCILSIIAQEIFSENDLSFDLQFTPSQFQKLVSCYFTIAGVKTMMTHKGKYSVTLTEFVTLFSNKGYVNLLHRIANAIDEIRFCRSDFPILNTATSSILPEYRKAIVSLQFSEAVFDTHLDHLIETFPNYKPMKINTTLLSNICHPKHFLSAVFESGEIALAAEKMQAYLEDVFKADPSNIFAGELLCIAYKRKGRLQEAEYILHSIIDTKQQSYLTLHTLGALFMDKEEDDNAIETFQKVIEMNPKHIVAYRLLSLLFERNQRFIEAKRILEMSLAVYPNDTHSLQLLKFLGSKAG